MTIELLMRSDLQTMEPYGAPPPLREIEARIGRPIARLDANENPYGPSPLVAEALRRCCVARYPDPTCSLLRKRLGDYLRVDPARIACAAGGDEMIDLLLRLFIEPGDALIDCPPSFVMYPATARSHRAEYVAVPRRDGLRVEVEAVIRAVTPRTKLIFLCSPNNPTGNPTPTEDIHRLLETGRVVVLDEAYAEFAGRTLVQLCETHANLVVLRTMSKWAALAGVRLGYAVVHPSVVRAMERVVSPFHVSAPAQAAGVASLEDRAWLMENVRRIVAERDRLYARLVRLPFGRVYPSETNFLYWTTDGVDAGRLRDALAHRGVLVRARRDPVDALRFSIGTSQESGWLLDALEEAYAHVAG